MGLMGDGGVHEAIEFAREAGIKEGQRRAYLAAIGVARLNPGRDGGGMFIATRLEELMESDAPLPPADVGTQMLRELKAIQALMQGHSDRLAHMDRKADEDRATAAVQRQESRAMAKELVSAIQDCAKALWGAHEPDQQDTVDGRDVEPGDGVHEDQPGL